MFTLQLGQGIGFAGSRELAFGLGGDVGLVIEKDFTHDRFRDQIIREDDELLMLAQSFIKIISC